MVQIRPPLKVVPPMPEPGMAIHTFPPHLNFVEDYEYYDHLGRDPLQLSLIWTVSDPAERVEKLKEVLTKHPKQKHRRKMLWEASKRGDEAIVGYLVDTGLEVHRDLQKALKAQEEIEEAGDGGGDDNGADDGDIPDIVDTSVAPLHIAASCNRLECVKIFIESGVEVDARDDSGCTPLIAAADGGALEVMRYLLDQGASPTARAISESDIAPNGSWSGENTGLDALEVLSNQGNIEAVKLLLEHPLKGSMRKRKNGEDEEPGVWVTPLAIKRSARGNFELLKLLLERGAYPLEDKDNKSKAELVNEEQKQVIIDATQAVIEGGDMNSLKLLLSYHYPTDKDGNILPFEVPEELRKSFVRGAYHAIKLNSIEKFEFLYSFGVKEHEAMSLDRLPEGQMLSIQHLFDTAAETGSIDCARLLIEKYGADPNKHRVPSGVQPLFAAAANDKTEMVRYLLENHKIDLHLGNGRYAAGPTALWVAIHLKSLDIVALLLQHGGPVDHIDKEIRNIQTPIKAILKIVYGELPVLRFETEANAREYIESARQDFHRLNPGYVRVELDPDDKSWISTLQLRRPDEELREEGEGARELNEKEGVDTDYLDRLDVRRILAALPTNRPREDKLTTDNDLIPKFVPAFS